MCITNYLCLPINFYFIVIFKVAYFSPKKYAISKKSIKFIIPFFFLKEIIGHTYIFTKCIDNFKFNISLKSLLGLSFP